MKRTVRPLFSILILLVFAVTFSCRTVVRLSLISFEQDTNVVVHKPATPVFNATLLKFAAMDPGEAQFKQEIEQLLEGNFGSRRTYRTFATWRRFHHHDVRSRSSTGLPVSLNSPGFYRYWLDFRRTLNDWARKRKFQSEIMSELLSMVKLPLDMHIGLASQSQQRYTTCAVVGNSGILLQSDYGQLIDSHAFVIRLNNARVKTYESKVGSKTSISFINSNILHLCARREGCYCHPYGFNVPIVMYICQPVHFLDYTICNSSHKPPLLVTDPRFDVLCSRVVKYYSIKRFVEQTRKSLEEWSTAHDGPMFHYSSGVQAVMLALGICDKVSIFGFGKVASAKHHYHTNQKSELSLHDYEAEYAFYHDLMEKPHEIPFISDKFKVPPVVLYQ